MTELTVQQAYDLGVEHLRAGRRGDAESVFQQVIAADPNHLPSLLGLAQIQYQTGRAFLAIDALRRAIALDPRNSDLQGNLGTVLAATGRLDEAIATFSQAISINPNVAGLYSNLGNALQARGRYAEAEEACRKAVALDRLSPDAHNNLGTVLTALDRTDDAIPEFRLALALRPKFVHALNNLGTALGEKGKLDEAIQCCLRALELDPDFLGAYRNLGNSYRDAGQLDDAITSYRKAAARGTDPAAVDELFIALLLHPHLTRQQLWQEHVDWNRQYATPLRPAQFAHRNDREENRRLRIGYVSPDFSHHPVGRFFFPIISNHDHARFEIFCYNETRRPDPLTQQIRDHADVWRQTLGLPDDQLARLIGQDRIDILVDLTMHTKRNRLLVFARKPAPVQATYLAYPGTTGLETMDYRLTDPCLDPPDAAQNSYSETSIHLRSFWCYQPHRLAPSVGPLPASSRRGVTFGCLNLFAKMNPPIFELWARILANFPGARLILYCFEGRQRVRTLDFFASRAVDPGRIEFVPRIAPADYFAKYHQIDIALDTFPFPGGTTTCDALYMGVPVVTLAGDSPLSRGGVSVLSNAGLPELIATTPEQYVRIATDLANDLPRLADLRARLRDRLTVSPLMDAPRHAKDVEAAFRQMWHRWCGTNAPLE